MLQNEIGVLVENGGINFLRHQRTWKVLNSTLAAIILHDEEEETTPDEKKAIFYAAAELAVRYYFWFLNNPGTYPNSRITDSNPGRAGPARLASCIGEIPS